MVYVIGILNITIKYFVKSTFLTALRDDSLNFPSFDTVSEKLFNDENMIKLVELLVIKYFICTIRDAIMVLKWSVMVLLDQGPNEQNNKKMKELKCVTGI